MANPTTNFGWVMPTTTSLVTNLPADFNTFGQGVDTSMAGLLGGTTGQILSKTSATNMAFTWINNDQGDITGVTAGTGISGGGTSGDVTISINTAVTADLTTAQTFTNKKLSDSTTTIVDVTDATKAVKFDVGGTTAITGTIATNFTTAKTITIPDATDTLVGKATTDTLTNKTLTSPVLTTPTISTATTNGDLLYGTGSGALTRLGIGSSAQVLTVSGGVPSWATPASGGGMTSLATGSLSGGSTSITGISGSYNNLQIILRDFEFSQDGYLGFGLNADAGSNYRSKMSFNTSTTAVTNNAYSSSKFFLNATNASNLTTNNYFAVITIYDYANAATYKLVEASSFTQDQAGSFWTVAQMNGGWLDTSAVTSVQIQTEGSPTTFTAGSYVVYGVK